MVTDNKPVTSPQNPKDPPRKQSHAVENAGKDDTLFSPRFRSVAAMAGWDEEALLVASLVVEDTPDRQIKHKKRSNLQNFKTPPTNSTRKRRAQRRSPASIPVVVLDLDEDGSTSKQESEKNKIQSRVPAEMEKKTGDDELDTKGSKSTGEIPCIDRLREELSCAICLDICFEPSTTPCGHSFCKKCLRSAADKCGKRCPKCRDLVRNGRSCKVNTVLWNTIQLLFPQEVEARKAAAASPSSNTESQPKSAARVSHYNVRSRIIDALNSPESETRDPERRSHRIRSRSFRSSSRRDVSVRARELPSQDEDAAFALRLQREEFMEAFRSPSEPRNSLALARANLRAMASHAANIRVRRHGN
ncbi:E3 ubiquitin- ligase RING1a [Olea europaea subsp. europaea]|uniref:RING-type E3 ubiquitin transferase n=1 Tax=Olea europaea subsp. europaea TaxID=158383 RepID=A0A8S0S3C3_OLEEU|nr:E3 ubiquitin- ligase RING1a [Olea europaea subsp. europaea]